MELRHLRYFLAVAETNNFTRAAERSYVAQSALSEQIARLEAQIGTLLFHRTTRRVSLTPAGETLRPLAARIIADVDHAQDEMSALTGLRKGRLRLGIIQYSAGVVDLVDLVSVYRSRHPTIELRVRSGASKEMADAVTRGELDVAIVGLPPADLPATLTHHSIVDDPLVAVLSHEAARGAPEPISLADLLARGPFIHFLPGSGIRNAISAAFERANLNVEGAFELDQVSDMIRLAAAGAGVTAVPSTSAQRVTTEHGAPSPFATLALADQQTIHTVGVVYDANRLSAAAAALVATLPIHR